MTAELGLAWLARVAAPNEGTATGFWQPGHLTFFPASSSLAESFFWQEPQVKEIMHGLRAALGRLATAICCGSDSEDKWLPSPNMQAVGAAVTWSYHRSRF